VADWDSPGLMVNNTNAGRSRIAGLEAAILKPLFEGHLALLSVPSVDESNAFQESLLFCSRGLFNRV
jgi:hypothetical protein